MYEPKALNLKSFITMCIKEKQTESRIEIVCVFADSLLGA